MNSPPPLPTKSTNRLLPSVTNANACLGILPESAPQNREIRNALAEIVEDADRASAIVKRVRQLARKAPPDKTLLDMKKVVAGVLAFARIRDRNPAGDHGY